jgi:hypothetical protein
MRLPAAPRKEKAGFQHTVVASHYLSKADEQRQFAPEIPGFLAPGVAA